MSDLEMKDFFYVYEHWRPDLGTCFYVGKGQRARANDMKAGRNRHHLAIQHKLSRLGLCVEIKVVEKNLSEERAFELEIERISFWRNDGADLANIGNGGNGCSGIKRSEQHKLAISKKLKGRKFSPETLAKMGRSSRGNTYVKDFVKRGGKFNYSEQGMKAMHRPRSEEHKRKLRESVLATLDRKKAGVI